MKLSALIFCFYMGLKAYCCSWCCPSSNNPAPNAIPQNNTDTIAIDGGISTKQFDKDMHTKQTFTSSNQRSQNDVNGLVECIPFDLDGVAPNLIPQSETDRIAHDGGFCLVFDSNPELGNLIDKIGQAQEDVFAKHFEINDISSKTDEERLRFAKFVKSKIDEIDLDGLQALKALPQKQELKDVKQGFCIIIDPVILETNSREKKITFKSLYAKCDQGKFYLLKMVLSVNGEMNGYKNCQGFTDKDKHDSSMFWEHIKSIGSYKIFHKMLPGIRREGDANLNELIISNPPVFYDPGFEQITEIEGETIDFDIPIPYKSVAVMAKIKDTNIDVLVRCNGFGADEAKMIFEYVIPNTDGTEFVRTDKQGAIDFYFQDRHNLLQ